MPTVPVSYQIQCSGQVAAVGAYQICQPEALLGIKMRSSSAAFSTALLIPFSSFPLLHGRRSKSRRAPLYVMSHRVRSGLGTPLAFAAWARLPFDLTVLAFPLVYRLEMRMGVPGPKQNRARLRRSWIFGRRGSEV